MVLVLTAIISFCLLSLSLALIAITLHGSGAAILSALAGEARFELAKSKPHVRRAVRVRNQKVSFAPPLMRVAA